MATTAEIVRRIKRATVAVVISQTRNLPNKPFVTVGTGFCIHSDGIVVTCEHVQRAFLDQETIAKLPTVASSKEKREFEAKSIVPHVLFPHDVVGTHVTMIPVPVLAAVTKTNFDLAVFKLHRHSAFRNGFPTVEIADYADIEELMEIATCGFPLGDEMFTQLKNASSSLTKGTLSAILPIAGVSRAHVAGFQLDITATHGNSGGPVFCLSNGHVFGVLQKGVAPLGEAKPYPGFAKAEPIYAILDDGTIDRLLKSQGPPNINANRPAQNS